MNSTAKPIELVLGEIMALRTLLQATISFVSTAEGVNTVEFLKTMSIEAQNKLNMDSIHGQGIDGNVVKARAETTIDQLLDAIRTAQEKR